MSAKVCPFTNGRGKRTNIQPVVVLSKNTNEDNSGNFHKLLENQLNSLYSYIGGAEYSLTGDLLFHRSSLPYKSLEFPSLSMQPELIFGI